MTPVMTPICQCGCGESLPEGSTRQYKRGHKARVTNPETETGFVETPIVDESELAELFSIDEAARLTPDDPEPRSEPEFKAKTTIKITAAVKRDVEGKLAFALGLSGQLWAMADTVCATAYLEAAPDIAKKLTPIVCQSPDVVKWLTKSSNFILWIDLFMAVYPVLTIVFAHHIAKTITGDASQNGQRLAPTDYVVQ